jgi:hypothetical protein
MADPRIEPASQKRGYEPRQQSGTVTPVDQRPSRYFLNPMLEPLRHNTVESVAVPVENLQPKTYPYTSFHHAPSAIQTP